MRTSFTAKAYYVFLLLLPLIFYSDIGDKILLPRQLLLSLFVLLQGFLIARVNRKDGRLRIDAVHLAMLIFLALSAIISLPNATVLSEAFYVLSKLWIVVSFSVMTGLLLRANLITGKQLINAGIIFGCAALGTALVDMTEKTMRGQNLFHWVYTILGSFGNKNLLTSILFLCLPFFMIGLREKRYIRIVSWVSLFLIVAFVVILRTRIVMIATAVFFGLFILFYGVDYVKGKLRWLGGAFVALTIVAVLCYSGGTSADSEKYFSRLLSADTLSERFLFWRNSWAMFREHPFGVGLGNWQIYFPKYGLSHFQYDIANGITTVQRPHNDFLWVLCETGILGFAVFLCIFVGVIYRSFRLIKRAGNKDEKWLSVSLFSGVVGFVFIAFFDFPMERIEHLVLLMLLFALIVHRYETIGGNSLAVPVGKTALVFFVVCSACFSLYVAGTRFVAEKNVYKLQAARRDGYSQEALKFATDAESSLYQIDSKTIPMQWYKGVAEFSIRQYAESQASFENAYRLTPYNIHAMNNLASCYEVNGSRKKAIALYGKALRISPLFEEARLNLAAVYFNDKQFEKAFETIDSCATTSKDPKYKMFLPPILKAKAALLAEKLSAVSPDKKGTILNLPDYSQIYFVSKKNNITFEQQLISQLKNNL
ncbi:O-antigen ligase [Flavobacterium longum]|uniref:O-antigen ligase family protein n=1 Tax=Flavobacterium longum TaxID=1299340 RepID=UPI0039E7E43C